MGKLDVSYVDVSEGIADLLAVLRFTAAGTIFIL